MSTTSSPEAPAASGPPETKKRQFTFPSAYTILFLLVIVVTILTWVIPAGSYDYKDGKPVPGTYHHVAANPQRVFRDALQAPINGMYGIQDLTTGQVGPDNAGVLYGSINVALFILVIGGFLGITMKTGTIDTGIRLAVKRLGTRGELLIPILMVIFMIGGTTYGMAEESLAFYVLIIAAMIGLGYDALTGVAVLMLGCGIGVMGSTVNPFATGIASGFAGISLGDGIVSRLVILALGGVAGIWYVLRYARKVKQDPSKSPVYNMREANRQHFLTSGDQDEVVAMTGQQKLILGLFALAFLIMIYSVIPWDELDIHWLPTWGWWFPQLTALFLFFAIVIGIVGRMDEQTLTNNFVDGARDLLGVALVVAIARGISVIMNNGLITDTVLNWAAQATSGLGAVAFAIVMFLVYLPLAFLIPSSSGLATVTMPIMAPLADLAHVPTNVVVTAFQSASGVVNLVTPTFAVVAGGLAIGRVPFNTWWRFALPLVFVLAIIDMVVLAAVAVIG
jgi:uncharacterized ion transporter superfamily protein YfcC